MIRGTLKPALALILFLAGAASPTMAQRTIVEIGKVQVVNALSGIVRDPRCANSGCDGCRGLARWEDGYSKHDDG